MSIRSTISVSSARLSTLIAIAFAGIALAGVANARDGGSCEHRGGLHGLERGIDRLQLDDERQAQVFELLDEARVTQRATRPELREAQETLRTLIDGENPDLEAVLAQTDLIATLRVEAKKSELRTLLALRNVLTQEEWDTIRPQRDTARARGPHARGRRL